MNTFFSTKQGRAFLSEDWLRSSDSLQPSPPILKYVNGTVAFTSWSFNPDYSAYGSPSSFEVELSLGALSQDFEVVASTLALCRFQGAPEWDSPVEARGRVCDGDVFGEAFLTALSPGEVYSVRVCPVFNRGRGLCSTVTSFTTLTMAADTYWEAVWPRRLATVANGRGLAAPVLQRPHLDLGVEVFGARASLNPLRVTDPATSLTPVLPSARRGHSMSAVQDQVFMFGGRTDGAPSFRLHINYCHPL